MHGPTVCSEAGEKYLMKGEDVFCTFIGLENASDTIDRHRMWQMLGVFGVGGRLLKAVRDFYVECKACVRAGMDVVFGYCRIETGLLDDSMVV